MLKKMKPSQDSFQKELRILFHGKILFQSNLRLIFFSEKFSINLLIANGQIGKATTKEVEYVHTVVVLTVLLTEVPKKN